MKRESVEKPEKIGIREKLTRMLELPKEIVKNLPLITIIGKEEVTIENYKGIIEYTPERIRINTSCGVFKIEGKKLDLRQITTEAITVIGFISKLEYIL